MTTTVQTSITAMSSKMVQLTRVYSKKGTSTKATPKIVKQRVMVSADAVTSFRPRSKMEGHKTTLVLSNKQVVNVAETFEAVKASLAKAGVSFI